MNCLKTPTRMLPVVAHAQEVEVLGAVVVVVPEVIAVNEIAVEPVVDVVVEAGWDD